MITKPSIIITSIGRTGTLFFQRLLGDVISDSTALHEPDYLNFGQYPGLAERWRQVSKQIGESGLSNLVFRKGLGRWGLVELSDARIRGQLSDHEAVRRILDQRKAFVQSRKGTTYIESSSAYYGLIDVLKEVYEKARIAYIIRDGRTWVQSKMNFGKMYKKGPIRRSVSHTWPTALEIGNDTYRSKWPSMSRFEKLCWAWVRLNTYALKTLEQNPNARLFFFEKIFEAEKRLEYLSEMVRFLTVFVRPQDVTEGSLGQWIHRRIHKSPKKFAAWNGWSVEHREGFEEICGPLMKQLGYEF